MFMYMFLGGWYKAFGIEGDSLPEMCQHLFTDYSSGLAMIEDEEGLVGHTLQNVHCVMCAAWKCWRFAWNDVY